MKKLIGFGLLAATLAAPLSAFAADSIDWVNWSGYTGSVVQNGTTVDVTYTGTAFGNTHADYFTGYDGAYLSAGVTNGPANEGVLTFVGGTDAVHHVHFSSALINPYMAVVSLGRGGVQASLNFSNVSSIDLVSEGAGYYGNGEMTVAGGVVSGIEGHGVVRLNGTFTDLYFITPVSEYWYGATFGVPIAAVPEPGTWGMLGVGFGMLGLMRLRRKVIKA